MSERDYESYNMLGEMLENDTELTKPEDDRNKQEIVENTGLVTVQTKLQTVIEDEQSSKDFYHEAEYYEEPNIEEPKVEEPTKETEQTQSKKEKFKIKFPTFKKFKEAKQSKERKPWQKVAIALGVIALAILLAPFIFCALTAFILLIGGILSVTVGSILTGIVVLGSVCFFASHLSISMLVGGIALGICGISFGLIIATLIVILMKWIVKRIKAKRLEKRGI